MAYIPLNTLFKSELYENYHSLIPFIPFISLYLIYIGRKSIFNSLQYRPTLGGVLILFGLIFYFLANNLGPNLNVNDLASIKVSSVLVWLWGAFILMYGIEAFKKSLFPLLFLIFTIPFPMQLMHALVVFLQEGSTEFTNLLLWLSQAPYYREGFVFHLPGMSVEVAPQCSGIRSGLALFITGLLAGYMFLRSGWRRFILVLLVVPITMLKNGIRITTLTLLGTYVDPRILQSSLHREGGIPFFILALVLMAPILFFLRKSELKKEKLKREEIRGKDSSSLRSTL